LDPIIDIFYENGSRYNLFNSVFIDLINYIVDQKLKNLIDYLMEDHEKKI